MRVENIKFCYKMLFCICVIEKDTKQLYYLTSKFYNPISQEDKYDNIEIDLSIMNKEGRTSYCLGNHEVYYISECSERVIHL